MTDVTFERLELDDVGWDALDSFPDRSVFQTREWLSFVAEAQNAEPVVCSVKLGAAPIGYFTGLVVRRFGVRILGSPFPGWGTGYMGFNLLPGTPRRDAAEALFRYAFGSLRCLHVELRDRQLSLEDARRLGGEPDRFTTSEVNLRQPEDEIWASFKGSVRTAVRKAAKVGVVVEEAGDLGFADDYQAQLEEVFAKQSLRPTYGVDRVRALITHVYPNGRLLLLRARDPEGKCIGTGIFPTHGRTMYFWGGASWRAHQGFNPNEAIIWHAMRHAKRRGAEAFDMGGGGEYKRKYGGEELVVPHLVRSRFPGLRTMRDLAKRVRDPDGIGSRVKAVVRRGV